MRDWSIIDRKVFQRSGLVYSTTYAYLVATSAATNGRDGVPRLASRLHLPYVPNCLSLDELDGELFALRSIYKGRAYIQTRTTFAGHAALATHVPGIS